MYVCLSIYLTLLMEVIFDCVPKSCIAYIHTVSPCPPSLDFLQLVLKAQSFFITCVYAVSLFCATAVQSSLVQSKAKAEANVTCLFLLPPHCTELEGVRRSCQLAACLYLLGSFADTLTHCSLTTALSEGGGELLIIYI